MGIPSPTVEPTDEQRRAFVDRARGRFGERLAEIRLAPDGCFELTVFDPADAAQVAELGRAEGVKAWLRVLVAESSDLAAWEELRHELIRLRGVEPRVLSMHSTPSPGYRRPPVAIHLTAHAGGTARALHARFGSFVAVSVGFLTFPSRARSTWTDRLIAPVRYSFQTPVELIEPVSVRSGHNVRAALSLTNHTSGPITVGTNGSLTALVVDAAGHVVGSYAGGQTSPLVQFKAEPGATVRIPVLIGTASLEPALGYAVPPGTWDVVAPLWDRDGQRVCTPPVPITIT